MTAVLLAIARHDGCSWEELGLDRRHLRSGFAWGGGIFAAILGVYLVGLALPFTRELFEDERVGDVPFWGMAYQVLFRIPFGTVLLEEVAFRGVLLGVFLRRTTPWRAAAWSSLLFGFWHVLPSIGIESKNPVLEDLFGGGAAWAAVVAAVVGTALAGMVFCFLRLRSGSLVAPVLLHIATNSLGFVVSWTYLRFR
jgi:membrane protease YdiL (CAAX protease family)